MPLVTLPEIPEGEAMLTFRDIANVLGVSHTTVGRIARQPGFPVFHYKRTYRVPREAFQRWMAQQIGQGAGAQSS